MKILISYGTRPEYIKLEPLIRNLDCETLFTGQHLDLIRDHQPDYMIQIEKESSNRLDNIISSILSEDDIFTGITHVVVQGDTTSALAVAITAFNHGVKIIHLEAGLRTYDLKNPYPEEGNRQMISRLASVHLCATELNKKNLIEEKVSGDIYVVGNTVLDGIDKSGTSYENIVLITLHRRENHHLIEGYFNILSKLAGDNPELEFIIPLHPNPNVQKHKDLLKDITVIDPIPREKMLTLMKKANFIITDSGGVQEEGSYLNKVSIVCRKITERVESVGTHSYLCEHPEMLEDIFYKIKKDYCVDYPCPYGDGHSTERILEIFIKISSSSQEPL